MQLIARLLFIVSVILLFLAHEMAVACENICTKYKYLTRPSQMMISSYNMHNSYTLHKKISRFKITKKITYLISTSHTCSDRGFIHGVDSTSPPPLSGEIQG